MKCGRVNWYVIYIYMYIYYIIHKYLCVFAGCWHRINVSTMAQFQIGMMTISNGDIWLSVNSPHKGQWRETLMFSLICPWLNGWVNNGEAGDLRRHRAHYDVTVMYICSIPNGWALASQPAAADSCLSLWSWVRIPHPSSRFCQLWEYISVSLCQCISATNSICARRLNN